VTEFHVIPAKAWNLHRPIARDQQSAVNTFEQIVDSIKKKATVRVHRRERKKKSLEGPHYRVRIKLKVDRKAVDLFHNSRAGYRAQYYYSITNDERANRYFIRQLCPRVVDLLKKTHKRTCPPSLIQASLLGQYTKVWINQGSWVRTARHHDRLLKPKRWAEKNGKNLEKRQRTLLRWGSLAPQTETCIDLIGTFVTLKGRPIKKNHKLNRSMEIHEYGFT